MATTVARLGTGHLAVPQGWTLVHQLEAVEPARNADGLMTAAKALPVPPARLQVVQRASAGASPAGVMQGFVRDLSAAVRGLRVVEEAPFDFEDGAAGASVTVTFEILAGQPVAQRHVFRVDGAVATHLQASVPHASAARLGADLGRLLAAFRMDEQTRVAP